MAQSAVTEPAKDHLSMNLRYSPKNNKILLFKNQRKYFEDMVVRAASAIEVVVVFWKTSAQIFNPINRYTEGE